MGLGQKNCIPCQGGILPLPQDQALTFMEGIPEWAIIGDAKHIYRKFLFKDFSSALRFVNKIGDLAEEQGHHPDISFGWGYVDVAIYTHKISGLHENDFIMATKIGILYPD